MGFLFGGGGSSVSVPPVPATPPAAPPPTLANPAVSMAGAAARSRATALQAGGFAGTITNAGGALGQAPPNIAAAPGPRSLLG